MAKKTLAFFLALCLAVALTALGEEEIVLKISAVPDFLEQEPEFFKKQHPNVTIQVDGGYNIPPQALAQAMLTKDQAYDMYVIRYDAGGFDQLVNKEYVVNLAAYPQITEKIEKMYSYLQQSLQTQGFIGGIMVGLNRFGMGYYPNNMKAVGLEEEDVPQTYEEVIDFALWWNQEGKAQNPGYVFLRGSEDFKERFVDQMIQSYTQQAAYQNTVPDFTDPGFLATLEKLETFDDDFIKEEMRQSGEMNFIDQALLDDGANWTDLSGMPGALEPLPLTFGQQQKTMYGIRGIVLFINPNSPHIDLCVDYIENYMNHLSTEQTILLFSGSYQGVEREGYQEERQQLLEGIGRMEEELKIAAEYEKAPLEEKIAKWNKAVQSSQEGRWAISPYATQNYQNLIEQEALFIIPQGILTDLAVGTQGGDQLEKMIQNFCRGQQTAQSLGTELNRVVHIILLESQ